jgi:predicted DNA binding CopG/RHH family protein
MEEQIELFKEKKKSLNLLVTESFYYDVKLKAKSEEMTIAAYVRSLIKEDLKKG